MDSVEVKVPDIGEFTDVDVIEVMVKPGDTVGIDDPLIAIESEKATMEVPAPQSGVIKEIKVKLGDKVSEGSLILTLEAAKTPTAETIASSAPLAPDSSPAPGQPTALHLVRLSPATANSAPATAPAERPSSTDASTVAAVPIENESALAHKPHASPSVRKFAREL